ncbi:MAG: gamma-glutamylcyclotransferase [Alphaproteobacteria bacterium]|nr:gamma-glutamylcyclotransferase [Alphaproteobacteria bacterium]
MTYGRDSIRDGLFEEIGLEAERLGLLRCCTDEERAESRARMLAGMGADEDVWIFGYGSLMWNPAFHFAERRPGMIRGWHRSFCLWTPMGRGTPDNPGLVLGLDRGGSCSGIVYRVAARDRDTELTLLWQREMVADGYNARWVTVRGEAGDVRAITWVINPKGDRYAGKLPMETLARTLATASGRLGSNRDYLENTVERLDELGIGERLLHAIRDEVRDYARMNGGE